jgi:hypothetical protein
LINTEQDVEIAANEKEAIKPHQPGLLKQFGTVVDKLDKVENAVGTVRNDKEAETNRRAETFRMLARRLTTVTKKLVEA